MAYWGDLLFLKNPPCIMQKCLITYGQPKNTTPNITEGAQQQSDALATKL